MARHGVIVEHEQKLKKAQEAHERKLERNRRWYEANKEKVRLAMSCRLLSHWYRKKRAMKQQRKAKYR